MILGSDCGKNAIDRLPGAVSEGLSLKERCKSCFCILRDRELFHFSGGRTDGVAHVINKSGPGSFVPMLHSSLTSRSFSRFLVKADYNALIVVISTDVFKPDDVKSGGVAKGKGVGAQSVDFQLGGEYVRFIHGYLEGCYFSRTSLQN